MKTIWVNSKALRFVVEDNTTWFNAKDVASFVKGGPPEETVKTFPKEHQCFMQTNGGLQKCRVISVSTMLNRIAYYDRRYARNYLFKVYKELRFAGIKFEVLPSFNKQQRYKQTSRSKVPGHTTASKKLNVVKPTFVPERWLPSEGEGE